VAFIVSLLIQLYKEYDLSVPCIFIALLVSGFFRCEYDIQRTNEIKPMLDVFFQCAQLFLSYVNQVRREGWSSMWAK
jgi:hypothetical protein